MVAAIAAAVGPEVPLVAVMVHGGSMDISGVIENCHAVLDAFYPGMYGGQARHCPALPCPALPCPAPQTPQKLLVFVVCCAP